MHGHSEVLQHDQQGGVSHVRERGTTRSDVRRGEEEGIGTRDRSKESRGEGGELCGESRNFFQLCTSPHVVQTSRSK